MKLFFKILFFLILIMALLINVFSAFDKPFLGIRIFKIGSGSMEPTLKVNDMIIIKANNNYNIDDIVTFKDKENKYITHRIIEIEGDVITTKGDSNNTNDPNITKEDIIGKMIYRFGIFSFLSYLLLKPFSWILIFVIGVFLIILMPVRTRRRRHSKE